MYRISRLAQKTVLVGNETQRKTNPLVDYTHLNPAQRDAVFHRDGALLVLAGAGSGKTGVITYRIARLIETGVSPHSILALSFTNKAANEMKERVHGLVGAVGRGTILSTFHSLGLRILKEEYEAAGLNKGFTILDEGDQLAAVKSLISAAGYDPDHFEPKLIHGLLSHYKSRLERPDPRKGGLEGVAAAIAPLYGQRLRAMNAVDFDDLIARPVWLLERHEQLAYRWSGRFQYIMVDEYQDTNLSQLRLLKALSKRHNNVCAVGDDDQSIYGWRGAEAGNILRFGDHFPGAEQIALTQNYRSTNCILRAANELIQNNRERHAKSLWSELGEGDKLRYFEAPDGEEEARWVASDLVGRRRTARIKWSDIAILYRTNAQSRVIEEAVRRLDIPYKIIGGTRFYDRKEVRDLIGYLRVIANPWDEAALRRIINFPSRGIGDISIQKIADYAGQTNQPFFRLVENPSSVPGLTDNVRNALLKFWSFIDEFRAQASQPSSDLGMICRTLVSKIDFRNTFTRTEKSQQRVLQRMDNLEEVAVALDSFRHREPNGSLEDYLTQLTLDPRQEEEDDNEDQVSLMTLHGSKGLEFNSVYLVGVEEGLMPHTRNPKRGAGDQMALPPDIPEERRLVYVGVTRARRLLTLTGAKKRFRFGKIVSRKPSRFLFEMPESLFQGGRSGLVPELKGEALQTKGISAFNELIDLVSSD